VIPLLVAAASVQFACAFLLWDRVTIARARLRTRHGEAADYWGVLEAQVETHLDSTLRGFEHRDVPHREQHDPYRPVGDLLRALPELHERADAPGRERFFKALFQLQGALGLPDAALDAVLEPVLRDLGGAPFLGVSIGAWERVRPGDALDRERMRPVTPGARVGQPLGLVLRGADGRLLSKAKVVCNH
jgi:hypothetical protein